MSYDFVIVSTLLATLTVSRQLLLTILSIIFKIGEDHKYLLLGVSQLDLLSVNLNGTTSSSISSEIVLCLYRISGGI
jgi:hypothetical protein